MDNVIPDFEYPASLRNITH